jgi:hypothetical protein
MNGRMTKDLKRKVRQYMSEEQRPTVVELPNFGVDTIAVNTLDELRGRPLLKRLAVAWRIVFRTKGKEET